MNLYWCSPPNNLSFAGTKGLAMKVAIASDHRGYHLKEKVISLLRAKGHEVIDDGPSSDASVDYPDFAALVARKHRHRHGHLRQ
jgi:ribose 5-phosphate isomerase RpiB